MSVKLQSAIWHRSPHKGGALLVLLAMADESRDEGLCWLSQANLAAKSRLSERQVRTVLRELEAAGAIQDTGRRIQRARVWQLIEPEETSASPEARTRKFATVQPEETSAELAEPETANPAVCDHRTRQFATANPEVCDRCIENRDEPKLETKPEDQTLAARELAAGDSPIVVEVLAPTASRPRNRDPIWDALEACFGPPPVSRNLRGAWNVAAKELRDQGATPEDVVARVRACRGSKHAWAAVTPMALAKHWGLPIEQAPGMASLALAARLREAGL